MQKYFRDWNIAQIDASAVDDFLRDNWPDKLPTQRAMKAWLSTFFSWAVLEKHVLVNPTRELKVKKPKARDVCIPSSHFMAIRDALFSESGLRPKEPWAKY